MQLSKGQKDALVRKVMTIIEEKKEQKRNELIAKYKPSKEIVEILERIKKYLNAKEKFFNTIKELGFTAKYSYVAFENEVLSGSGIGSDSYTESTRNFDDYAKLVRNAYIAKKFNKEYTYPDETNVIDDIELLNIGKSFDVDAFLEKYRNL